MFEWILIGVLVLMIIISNVLVFSYAQKKGMKDLLNLFLVNGYESKVAAFKNQNLHIKTGGTVFVGDSITQDFNVYEYFSEYLVYNRGIGGDTTKGLLKRLDESIFDLQPKHVIILMGTNDFGVLNDTPENIYERMKEICVKIRQQNDQIKIYIQSVYPVNETLDPLTVGFRTNHHIDLLNRLLASLDDVTFIDVSSILKDPVGRLIKSYTIEGLHINALGYEKITEYLKSKIAF